MNRILNNQQRDQVPGIWTANERAGDEDRATKGLENVDLTGHSQEHGSAEGHGQLLEAFDERHHLVHILRGSRQQLY